MQAFLRHHRTVCRPGFTLVELLVVMAIMAMLFALAYGMLGSSGNQARIASTQTTLKQIDAQIRQKTEAFRTANFTKDVERFITQFNAANATKISLQERKAVEILVRKNAFKSMLPQREEDLWGFDGVADDPMVWASGGGDDSPLLRQMYSGTNLKRGSWKYQDTYQDAAEDTPPRMAGTPPPNVGSITIQKAQSAELLYLCLAKGDAYGLTPVSLDGLPPRAIGDTDLDKNPEILDDWGEPVQFYNWPTQLMLTPVIAKQLIPALPNDLAKDPDDPLRVLAGDNSRFINDFAMTVPGTQPMKKRFGPDFYHDRADDANKDTTPVYHTPLVISAGPDRILGIEPPYSSGAQRLCRVSTPMNPQDVYDNVSNRQGR